MQPIYFSVKLHDMRADYRRGELHDAGLSADPLAQFAMWMQEACESALVEPNAMCLATVGTDGRPTQRMVLLKSFDERGFVFYTNLESRKARQIAENANVSLHFAWLPLARQVVISGRAERVPTAEAIAYFVSRPIGSQIGAWASPQSKVISTRALLEEKWQEAKRKFQEGRVPMPSFWGGYRVVVAEMEFWQGREHRLHDRIVYSRAGERGWKIQRLAP